MKPFWTPRTAVPPCWLLMFLCLLGAMFLGGCSRGSLLGRPRRRRRARDEILLGGCFCLAEVRRFPARMPSAGNPGCTTAVPSSSSRGAPGYTAMALARGP